ncbi:glycosyl hydrolase [Methylibium rhizosphaerae]|uniref:glycosyl hydrolase n=1 Tax=Methylibium rhizosphaerae TaxID=2570323 RepID=UPI00112A2624|nr:glycosyl hydrolase [Methylibium rhizosphaerae]
MSGSVVAHDRGSGADRFVFGPYKDVTLALQPGTLELGTAATGQIQPLVAHGRSTLPAGVKALTWAFAVGECGEETWMGVDADKFAQANVPAFNAAGIDYIVSTGGAKGVFTCASDAGMEAFIARYSSPQLIGLDFDIEGTQTQEQIDALMLRIRTASKKHPRLRMSFTIATLAASDGSRGSLNATGERVLAALRRHGPEHYVVNLMVMDYGPAKRTNCVVAQGRCDMAASAMQAARNVSRKYGVPLSRIELTPMIGVNDVVENVFTLEDAKALAGLVRKHRMAGLHFWSLDRDTPCSGGTNEVSPICHSLTDRAPAAWSFTRTIGGLSDRR